MILSKHYNLLFLLLLFGCGQAENKNQTQWKTLEIGDYLLDFPSDFELIPQQGIDSYVGVVTGDSMRFSFDFGYYTNTLPLTTEEYLEEGDWRMSLSYRFMKQGVSYDQGTFPKVDVLSIRPATAADKAFAKEGDFVANCRHDSTEFTVAVPIPQQIKEYHFEIDTVNGQYRKICWSVNPQLYITGLYITDCNAYNASMNAYKALNLITAHITEEQQKLALQIFRTVRRKR